MKPSINETGAEERLLLIEEAFLKLADDDRIREKLPEADAAVERLKSAKAGGSEDEAEAAFLELYCLLHSLGSVYENQERQTLDHKRGYFNHPGGISPLVKASGFIKPDSTTADLGAGNGLQGLLFQYLYPHKKTELIELSEEMISVGKIYREILEIPTENVSWINGDIIDFSFSEIDFLYLYRPSRPIGEGIRLYEDLASKLKNRKKPLTIFSIADCLRDFLDPGHSVFYSDGHLTCFYKSHEPDHN